MEDRLRGLLWRLLGLGALVGLLWLLFHFLLPWGAPFLLAFALAALLEPAVGWLVRHRWPRSAAAGLCTLTLLALLLRGLSALLGWLGSLGTELANEIPALVQALGDWVRQLEAWAERTVRYAPEDSSELLSTALDSMGQALAGIPGSLSRAALSAVTGLAQAGPDLLLFAVTAGIGSYFCSASFPRVLAFLAAQVPEHWKRRFAGLGTDLKGSLGGWLRVQGILMGITFFELLGAFLLLGVKDGPWLAAVTALVDALPLFGAGIVLGPWALLSLLLGNLRRGLGLLIAWAVTALTRSCLEAKLLGDQIGLHPLASLMALYVGWRVWSVWGMLLFPVLLVTVRQLNDRGVVRLWRKV